MRERLSVDADYELVDFVVSAAVFVAVDDDEEYEKDDGVHGDV